MGVKSIFFSPSQIDKVFACAEVAELVDALGSGSSGCTPVRVRVSPSAPQESHLMGGFLIANLTKNLGNTQAFLPPQVSAPRADSPHRNIFPEDGAPVEFSCTTELAFPMSQIVLLMILSTGALLFRRLKLALLLNYLFTMYWGYVTIDTYSVLFTSWMGSLQPTLDSEQRLLCWPQLAF